MPILSCKDGSAGAFDGELQCTGYSAGDKERGLPIDASGKLLTGETFHDAADVKTIIRQRHLSDFYRCLTEKMLTYALGRGIEYYDTEMVDRIVDRLDHENGRFSAMLDGIVESSAFQQRRNNNVPAQNQALAVIGGFSNREAHAESAMKAHDFSRRRFLKGIGACVALSSLPFGLCDWRRRRLRGRHRRAGLATTATGAQAKVRSSTSRERRTPAELVAQG